jgi:hypothetical protein
MQRAHPATAVLILVCLLAFQTQTWARVALPCEHATELGDGCPMHGSSLTQGDPRAMPADADDPLFDCAKCALAYALGVLLVAPASDTVSSTPYLSVPERGSDDHFYRFFPEGRSRPPRPLLA